MFQRHSWIRRFFLLLPVLLVALQWGTDFVDPGNLLWKVPQVTQIDWLESRYTYMYLHLVSFVPVFLLSFDKKVHYYRRWGSLFPAIVLVAVVFILWDVYFTMRGVWGFNDQYLIGWRFLDLPVEEWLFFLTVPFACVFIYECLNVYVKRDWLAPFESKITLCLVFFFLLIALLFWSHMYTATTFLLAGFFLLYHYIYVPGQYRGRFYAAYLVSWIPFLLVNGVLTGGYTSEPVVLYNPEEYLGLRITSVPADDSVYSFLLLLGVITLYEKFQKNRK